MTELPEYKIVRIFEAPRDLVWSAWTDPKILHRWYGPGAETTIHEFDLRPGGVWRNEMKWGGNTDLSKMTFQEVTPKHKIVWHHASVDANWDVASNPRMPDWPRVLLSTLLLEDMGDKTSSTLTQVPLGANDAELACFAKMMVNMDHGWGSGYKIIDEILVELQA